MPDHQTLREHRVLRWLGPWLQSPNLWHLNRRSVARGVAVGMFTGLFPPPLQMISAALASIVLRVNLPVAVLSTLYTNPLTMGPIYFVGYKLGEWVTGVRSPVRFDDLNLAAGVSLSAFWHGLGTLLSEMGHVFLIGVLLEGTLLAVAGYLLTDLLWRWHVLRAWRRRQRLRA